MTDIPTIETVIYNATGDKQLNISMTKNVSVTLKKNAETLIDNEVFEGAIMYITLSDGDTVSIMAADEGGQYEILNP